MSVQDLQDKWFKKYGHLSDAERIALIKKETRAALDDLKKADIRPTMSWREICIMTRGYDPEDESDKGLEHRRLRDL